MKAVSTSQGGFKHTVKIGGHSITVDEPTEKGGTGSGPTPQELLAASLVSCTAITMQLYAERKGWDLADLEVSAEFQPAERGALTTFEMVLTFPDNLDDDQVDKLRTIATKCPIHRTLEGEAMFKERVRRRSPA